MTTGLADSTHQTKMWTENFLCCDGLYLITLQLDKRGFLKKVNKGEPDIALCIPNMPAPSVGAYYMCAPAYVPSHE